MACRCSRLSEYSSGATSALVTPKQKAGRVLYPSRTLFKRPFNPLEPILAHRRVDVKSSNGDLTASHERVIISL